MKNRIIFLGEKFFKVFGFNNIQIIFSSKKYITFDSLLNSTKKFKILEEELVIPIRSVKELFYNEKDETFTIKYIKNRKIKKYKVLLQDKNMRASVVSEIAEIKNFHKNISTESKTKYLFFNLLRVMAILISTWLIRGVAVSAQNGHHYVDSRHGRRARDRQILINVVETLGPTVVTIIGILVLMYRLYVTYKRYNNPALDITYR